MFPHQARAFLIDNPEVAAEIDKAVREKTKPGPDGRAVQAVVPSEKAKDGKAEIAAARR